MTFFIGLEGDQLAAEQLADELAHFVGRVQQLDPTGFAATASMNLRFDHPALAAKLLQHGADLRDIGDGVVLRHGDAVFSKQLFGLILV